MSTDKEKKISMKPNEKRDMVVKEILKPMFKNAGFKCKGMNWWKELEDGYLSTAYFGYA